MNPLDFEKKEIKLFRNVPAADTKVYTLTIKGKKKMGRGLSLEELTEGKDYTLKIVPYKLPEEPSFRRFSFGRFRNTIEVGKEYPIPHFDRFECGGYDPNSDIFTYRINGRTFNVQLTSKETLKVISIK